MLPVDLFFLDLPHLIPHKLFVFTASTDPVQCYCATQPIINISCGENPSGLLWHFVRGYPTWSWYHGHLCRAFSREGHGWNETKWISDFCDFSQDILFVGSAVEVGLEFCLFLCPMGPQAVLICPSWFPVAIWRNSDFLHLKSHLQFLTISTCWKVTCAALKSPHQRLLWLSSWFLMLVLLSPCYWLNHLHTYCTLSPLLVLS